MAVHLPSSPNDLQTGTLYTRLYNVHVVTKKGLLVTPKNHLPKELTSSVLVPQSAIQVSLLVGHCAKMVHGGAVSRAKLN